MSGQPARSIKPAADEICRGNVVSGVAGKKDCSRITPGDSGNSGSSSGNQSNSAGSGSSGTGSSTSGSSSRPLGVTDEAWQEALSIVATKTETKDSRLVSIASLAVQARMLLEKYGPLSRSKDGLHCRVGEGGNAERIPFIYQLYFARPDIMKDSPVGYGNSMASLGYDEHPRCDTNKSNCKYKSEDRRLVYKDLGSVIATSLYPRHNFYFGPVSLHSFYGGGTNGSGYGNGSALLKGILHSGTINCTYSYLGTGTTRLRIDATDLQKLVFIMTDLEGRMIAESNRAKVYQR